MYLSCPKITFWTSFCELGAEAGQGPNCPWRAGLSWYSSLHQDGLCLFRLLRTSLRLDRYLISLRKEHRKESGYFPLHHCMSGRGSPCIWSSPSSLQCLRSRHCASKTKNKIISFSTFNPWGFSLIHFQFVLLIKDQSLS